MLTGAGGHARVVAGGTDLFVKIRRMDAFEEHLTLVDITQIEEMGGIKMVGSDLVIGAVSTMTEIERSPLIRNNARALAQGAGWMGAPQIRNVATIGGNVVNARPAADTAVPLAALGAKANVASPEGQKELDVLELYAGVGKSTIDPTRQILTHFRIPACMPPKQASAMQRLSKRRAFTLPLLSAAVRVELTEDGERIKWARIIVAPVSDRPWRALRAEEFLQNATIMTANLKRAAILAREDATPRDSIRGSAAYRKDMVAVLVQRALSDALKQIKKGPHA